MKQQDLRSMDRLDVSSDMLKAYLINMGKAIFFIVFIFALFYLLKYFAVINPFIDMFNEFGIPLAQVLYAIYGAIVIFILISMMDVHALTSNSLVFEGDNLTYSYGSIFKMTKSTPIANITKVNYNEYTPFKLGDVVVEFTGTEEASIKVQYVSNVKYKCELMNKLMNLKKAELAEEVREKGVV